MDRVVLGYDGNKDYLFEIENRKELEDAIYYKNAKRNDKKYEYYSDFEIIIDYLDKRDIAYKYYELMSAEYMEY